MNRDAPIRVFLSSTSEDLRHFREAAGAVIRDLRWDARMMEHFGSQAESTVEYCRKELASSQLVLVIIAFRRGWIPSVDQGGNGLDSVTALELAHARACGIPALAMLASNKWPGDLWEDDAEARAWVKKFRADLNLPAVFFDYEEPTLGAREQLPMFRAKVRETLVAHRERLLAQRAVSSDSGDFSGAALDGLRSGRLIPFVGTGAYGDGPLGPRALARALMPEGADELALASAAEYREGRERSRGNFLARLSEVVEHQQRQCQPPDVHHLLAGADATKLIVSATPDQLLEQCLTAAGRPFVTVAHVLHSFDGEHDGKLLVQRGDRAEVQTASELDIASAPLVIYKLLGAVAHYNLDPDAQLDTVVVTESDHLLFLQRLANKETSIPTALTREFRRRSLLFLGYDLDQWQYRLILHLFRSVGRPSSPISVCTPASGFEEEAWRRLQADLVRADPNAFARKAANLLGGPNANAAAG